MIETLLSVASGGLTGILGSAISRGIGIWETREKMRLVKVEFDHELELQKLQYKDREEERESETAIAQIGADSLAMVGSYRHDSSYGVASALRWVRPILTLLLISLTGTFYLLSESPDVKDFIAKEIVYLTATAVAWWFADRSKRTSN